MSDTKDGAASAAAAPVQPIDLSQLATRRDAPQPRQIPNPASGELQLRQALASRRYELRNSFIHKYLWVDGSLDVVATGEAIAAGLASFKS